MTSRVGRTAGALGLASMGPSPPVVRPPTLLQLKQRFLAKLEERGGMKRTNGWARTLQLAWRAADLDDDGLLSLRDFAHVVRATGNALTEAEAFQLFSSWTGKQGQTPRSTPLVALDVVHDDLAACQPEYSMGLAVGHDTRRAAGPTKAIRANESSIEGGVFGDWNYATEWRAVPAPSPRNAYRATPAGAGFSPAKAAGQTKQSNAPSVEGGLFAAAPPVVASPRKAKSSNTSSVEGGIFGAGPPLQAPRHKTQSNASSVRGGIFAASSRPGTAEYGRYVEPKEDRWTVAS